MGAGVPQGAEGEREYSGVELCGGADGSGGGCVGGLGLGEGAAEEEGGENVGCGEGCGTGGEERVSVGVEGGRFSSFFLAVIYSYLVTGWRSYWAVGTA